MLTVLFGSPALAQTYYDVRYEARLIPSKRSASVSIRVTQSERLLRSLRLSIDPALHRGFQGDGEVQTGIDFVLWRPPAAGGTLRYTFHIDQLRSDQSYDARCAATWAVFRGDDLVPPVTARARPGAQSRARLHLLLPEGWSAATRFRPAGNGGWEIRDPRRRFDRPTGWIVAGRNLGIVRERVAGVRVTIAGPAGQRLRRLDILALLRWTLPVLGEVVGNLPERLLVVGAGDPMWRGGLSGPSSLFIHADRPLITPDSTSPVLHEVFHAVVRRRAGPGDDWIVEGLAELYALEMLVRSKSISRARYDRALARQAAKGRRAANLQSDRAADNVKARAVDVLHALDLEIRRASSGARSLDEVVRALAAGNEPITSARLRAESEKVAGRGLGAFFRRHGVPLAPGTAAEKPDAR